MTKNQIEYWRNVEAQRSNLATEAETNRSNLARERETNRSNLANERENYRSNIAREYETTRHNKASEQLGNKQLKEAVRSNLAKETETRRNNMATLAEAARSNQAREQENTFARVADTKIRNRQASTAQYGAYTQRMQTESNVEKNIVSNLTSLAQLQEQSRSNMARESETSRSNRANENIAFNTYGLRRSELTETRRHNVQSELNQSRATTLNFVSSLANALGRVAGSLIRR